MTRGGWGDGTLTEVTAGKWKLRLPPYLGRGQVTFRAANKTAAKKEQRRILEQTYAERFNPATEDPTFDVWCDRMLANHVADPHSTARLRAGLVTARKAFGGKRLSELDHDTVTGWRAAQAKRVAAKTLHGYTQDVKQVLNAAVRSGLLTESPARHVKNPQPPVGNITPFETLDEVLAVAAELPSAFRALPVFGCLTGLRPEEWLALERSDIRDGFIHVNKRFTRGTFKQGTKNGAPERRVPLDPAVAEVLASMPRRIDTRLLFPGSTGNHLVLNDFRVKHWRPAFEAAGIPERRLKDMRHTFASWQLAGNCNLWTLSKVMGTAATQLERTYGRWIPGSERVVLSAMDSFLGRTANG